MWIWGRKGVSGYSASSTAEDVVRGIHASGLTAIVTGASSGIGTETARVLALCGVRVIMAVRNVQSGKEVKETIMKENPQAKIDVMELDLASFASITKFASDYNSSALPLNILINNAGIMVPSFMLSQDNIELHFATNHLGHFLLTNLLLDNMKKTARESQKEGRIINVSSVGHRFVGHQGIQFDEINDSSRYIYNYFLLNKYGQSKLANILHANELARRLKEEGVEITANSLNPGAVATPITRHYYGFANGIVDWINNLHLKNLPQGAATTCYVALHPQVKGVSGKYFENSNISEPSQLALDAGLAKKLWDFSLNMTQPSS